MFNCLHLTGTVSGSYLWDLWKMTLPPMCWRRHLAGIADKVPRVCACCSTVTCNMAKLPLCCEKKHHQMQ